MQIPGPDTRVVELRVHGILGTTGDDLTDSVASVDVAGDGIGRIVQPADRLRRPVPGPTLSAGNRTVPRVIEGYVWGAMTSGGLAKATWALLFPFALANMAHWMLPPTSRNRLSQLLGSVLRALLRLSALLLTMLLVAQLTVISLDLLAAQCLAPTSTCMGFVPGGVRASEMLRAALALLPLGLTVLLMHRLSAVSWRVSGSAKEASRHSRRAPMLPGANVVSDPDTPTLRALHVVGALAVIVLLALGGPFANTTDPRWMTAAALMGIAIIGTLVLDDPTGLRATPASAVLRAALGVLPRRTLIALGALLVIGVAIAPPDLEGQLPGSGGTVDALTALLLVTCVAVAVLLVPAALFARPEWLKLPKHLRPWAGGWMAAPILLIAGLLGNGFGAGLAIGLRQSLRDPALRLPPAYYDVTVFWGTTAVLAVLAALFGVPYVLINRWRRARSGSDVSEEIALLHARKQQDQHSAATAWHWADAQRHYSYRALVVLAGVLGVSIAFTLGTRLVGMPVTEWSGWLVSLGVTGLALLAGGLLRMVYLAAKRPKTAKHLGLLCDLTLFWPREAHPVVPPCYALKVIPELAARAAEHLADPNTRVVVVGHSQGSLLAAVATARLLETLSEEDRERVGLVTAGSQLQWAYPRGFPGVISHDSLRVLTGRLQGRWRSLCRGTDPIGGAVSTWNRQVFGGRLLGVGFRADGSEGPLPAAVRGPTGALVLGGDHWLPDPQRGPFSSRRWLPGVLGHTEYSSDPEWDRAVAMAAGLEMPDRGSTLPLRTPATTAPRAAETATEGTSLLVHGSDGGELPDPEPLPDVDVEWDDELTEVLAEARQAETNEPVARQNGHSGNYDPAHWQEEENRARRIELPEITDPPGRTAPWERGITEH